MPLDVAIYAVGPHHKRSTLICDSMKHGIKANGDLPTVIHESEYKNPVAPIAVFYGMVGALPKILSDYRAAGLKAIYIDLGYWGRHEGGRWSGYHKIAINSRHPTGYFSARRHDGLRAAELKVRPRDWIVNPEHILLAGMGAKGAEAEGFAPEAWERAAIAELRKHTDRPIVYRPKPSWKEAQPIEGTIFSHFTQDLHKVLRRCHAVVTHHSNVAVDGLVAGVPAFCVEGVARPLALDDLSKIEAPYRATDRMQWINDISYTQWSIGEMRRGKAWKHLKQEGLLG